MSFIVVIPARYASMRLPGKPLLLIGGKPMVQWVVETAIRSDASEVIVATDDSRIADVVSDPRDPERKIAVLTRIDHPSGTDRIAEAAKFKQWSDDTIVVNVQGDEPQLPFSLINQVARLLQEDASAHIATLSTPLTAIHELLDPNVVKVVTANDGSALYFSRAPIPWNRDNALGDLLTQTRFSHAQRHLGIYAYRVGALRRMTQLPPSSLEQTEKLEQLRALQANMRILVGVAEQVPGVGVDTEADLQKVRSAIDKK